MEAANPRAKIRALPRERAVRLGRNLPDGSSQDRRVTTAAIGAPPLETGGKDVGEIGLRRAGEANQRHSIQRALVAGAGNCPR